jgi:hypothetical protein
MKQKMKEKKTPDLIGPERDRVEDLATGFWLKTPVS